MAPILHLQSSFGDTRGARTSQRGLSPVIFTPLRTWFRDATPTSRRSFSSMRPVFPGVLGPRRSVTGEISRRALARGLEPLGMVA
jgi:hypothetical protein